MSHDKVTLMSDIIDEEINEYVQEVKERWGNTEAYKQSQERYNKLSKEEKDKIKLDSEVLMRSIVATMSKGIDSPEVQNLIDQHYNNLRTFYEPNLEIYRGLAEMYIADPRFTIYYEKYAKGLAQFMHDAMIYYVDTQK